MRRKKGQDIACEIVLKGLEEVVFDSKAAPTVDAETPATPPLIVDVPFEEHGTIKTAYRKEIEGFSSVRRIIEKYLDDNSWETPLSLAVFGPPGSGKSFTIKQILQSIDPNVARRPLEYNLSQFTDPGDLATVFHKVQDEALAGEVPLVFFDEFDAKVGVQDLGWLKYFL